MRPPRKSPQKRSRRPRPARATALHPAPKHTSNGHNAPTAEGRCSRHCGAGCRDTEQARLAGNPRRSCGAGQARKEQGYITFDDLSEILPDSVNEPEEMDAIMTRLRAMEIDIIDSSEVDRYKGRAEGPRRREEDKTDSKLDVLDDPGAGCTSSKWARCRC